MFIERGDKVTETNTEKYLLQIINCLKKSISKQQTHSALKVRHSGIYQRADICQRLLLADSRNFILELYPNYQSMKQAASSDEKSLIKNKQHPQMAFISRKGHFAFFDCFGSLGVKSFIDIEGGSYFYIPLQRFCEHITHYQSSLGMKHIEIMQYINYLNLYVESKAQDHCYVLNLYKNNRINCFSYDEVLSALTAHIDLSISAINNDLTITQEFPR